MTHTKSDIRKIVLKLVKDGRELYIRRKAREFLRGLRRER